jgi:hypothetical protein
MTVITLIQIFGFPVSFLVFLLQVKFMFHSNMLPSSFLRESSIIGYIPSTKQLLGLQLSENCSRALPFSNSL